LTEILKLSTDSLKLYADLSDLEVSPQTQNKNQYILGQTRAQSALKFGVAMQNPGYNVYVMGEPETGRLSMVTSHLDLLACTQETPQTYAYVDNFEKPREPLAISLPAGMAQSFCKDIENLIDNLLATFPAVFESPTYQQKKTSIERSFNQRYNKALDSVENKARSLNIALYRESDAVSFAPIRENKSLTEEQFNELPQQDREQYQKQTQELEDHLAETLLELPQWRREMSDKIKQLDSVTIRQAINPLFKELNDSYQNIDDAVTYLSEIKKDLRHTLIDVLVHPQVVEASDANKRKLLAEQYMPNILVDYSKENGAPVIFEPHPTYSNLFGRIEYMSDQGTLVTNYRHICPGALHRANGGYLILDAEKLLTYPYVWEGLKRALQSGRIEIESPYSELGVNPVTLKSEDIQLNIKIILVGSRDIYYLLQELDSEFNEIFRILADFDNHIDRTPESMQQFAALMTKLARDSGTKPLTRSAIECVIEHSSRLAENQDRLSARINDSLEIIGEAEFLRSTTDSETIDRQHIEQALAAREERNGRISINILEEMLDNTILIDTEGEAIGNINGLTVLEVGDSSFGAPARITTTVYSGSRGIVDIEREAELGQSIHSKGVLILTGYLGHCYAQQFPLAISASIAIEQSYGYIDGDSASLAELCCLISALTRVSIKQSFAITGSINQYGEVQAIGGVNEKIEGFFRLCQARGLNGDHAVIIPVANKRNLMLKQEVIDAVKQDLFSVYSVNNVTEALELLTGQLAGEMDDQGNYPKDTINFKAISRLKELSDMVVEKEEVGKE
jgi:lon-related putative ATP-dependent protease